jgi:hypothetical protein
MEMTWADTLLAKGMEKGREEGRREALLELLERRFGPLPAATVERVRGLTSSAEISRLLARVLDAGSIEDLGL